MFSKWKRRIKRSKSKPVLKLFVVCNVYWSDWQETDLDGPESGKFFLMFNQSGPFDPEAFSSIEIEGGGLSWSMSTGLFDPQKLSGFVPDKALNSTPWCQHFSRIGLLPNGLYTVTVRYADGRVCRASNLLDDDGRLLKAYRQSRLSFSPAGPCPLPKGGALTVRWQLVADVNAYYFLRFWRPEEGKPWGGSEMLHMDPIIAPDTGGGNDPLNKSCVDLFEPVIADVKYKWFVEVVDARRLRDANMVILLPWQTTECLTNPV